MIRLAFEPLDDLASEGAEPPILRGHGPVADVIGGVVGQLDHANAEIGEDVDAFEVAADLDGVLEAVDQADAVLGLGAQDVVDTPHLDQVSGVGAHCGVPGGDVADGDLERILVAGDIAEGDVDR